MVSSKIKNNAIIQVKKMPKNLNLYPHLPHVPNPNDNDSYLEEISLIKEEVLINFINIEFINKEGLSTKLSVPENITISELLDRYINTIQNYENNLLFLHNGKNLIEYSYKFVSTKIKNNDIINVLDIQ